MCHPCLWWYAAQDSYRHSILWKNLPYFTEIEMAFLVNEGPVKGF